MKKTDTKMLVTLGILIAMEIILSRFCSINAWNLKIGFSALPTAAAAILFGPIPAGIAFAVSDFIGAILFPIGAYFPGFTATAFLTGATFGLLFHKKQSPLRIILAVCINQLVFSLLLNSFWISVLYGSPYVPLLPTRVMQCAVLGPVQFIGICAISGVMSRIGKQVFA